MIDLNKQMAPIATYKQKDEAEIGIAIGRYFTNDDRDACECAIVVDDKWQNNGIGFALVLDLISDAKKKGIKQMFGEVWASNLKMIGLARKLGFKVVKSGDPKCVRITLNLQDL